jgi:hypothetical protein
VRHETLADGGELAVSEFAFEPRGGAAAPITEGEGFYDMRGPHPEKFCTPDDPNC